MRLDKESIPPRFEDSKDRLVYLLSEYKIGVYVAVGAVVALIVSGRMGLPSLPSWAILILQGYAIGIIPAMITAKLIVVDKFLPDPRTKVVEWVPDESGSTVAVRTYKVPGDIWSSREHEQGNPVIEPGGEADAIVSKFDYDDTLGTLTVRGFDTEIADPSAIQGVNGKLDEIFNGLLDDRKELLNLRSTLSLKQHKVEEQVINELVAAVEHGVAFEPSSSVFREDKFSEHEEPDRTDAVADEHDRVDGVTMTDDLGGLDAVADGGKHE